MLIGLHRGCRWLKNEDERSIFGRFFCALAVFCQPAWYACRTTCQCCKMPARIAQNSLLCSGGELLPRRPISLVYLGNIGPLTTAPLKNKNDLQERQPRTVIKLYSKTIQAQITRSSIWATKQYGVTVGVTDGVTNHYPKTTDSHPQRGRKNAKNAVFLLIRYPIFHYFEGKFAL